MSLANAPPDSGYMIFILQTGDTVVQNSQAEK